MPPQSVQTAGLVAASLQLTRNRTTERRPNSYPTKSGPMAGRNRDAVSRLRLTAPVLNRRGVWSVRGYRDSRRRQPSVSGSQELINVGR